MSTSMLRPYVCDRHDHVIVTYDGMWSEHCPLCNIAEEEIDPDECECTRVNKLETETEDLRDKVRELENKIEEYESTIEALDEVIAEASKLVDGNELPDDIAEKQIEAIDKLAELIAKAKAI